MRTTTQICRHLNVSKRSVSRIAVRYKWKQGRKGPHGMLTYEITDIELDIVKKDMATRYDRVESTDTNESGLMLQMLIDKRMSPVSFTTSQT